MKNTKNRCSNYMGTVNNDASGAADIAEIRKIVKNLNMIEKELGRLNSRYTRIIHKVALYGRLGKNNVNAYKYKSAYSFVPYSRIRLEDAATIDIYITKYRKVTVSRTNGESYTYLKSL